MLEILLLLFGYIHLSRIIRCGQFKYSILNLFEINAMIYLPLTRTIFSTFSLNYS